MQKLLVVLCGLLPLLLLGCTGSATLTKATSQRWYPGVEGANSGKNYVLTYDKPSGLEVRIERVWVGQRDKGWLPRFVVRPQESDTSDQHVARKGITSFTLHFTETFPGQPRRGEMSPSMVVPFDPVPSDLPAEFTNGVVIWYQAGQQKGSWIVSEFEELKPQYYP